MPYSLFYRQSYGDISSVAVPYFQVTQSYIKLKTTTTTPHQTRTHMISCNQAHSLIVIEKIDWYLFSYYRQTPNILKICIFVTGLKATFYTSTLVFYYNQIAISLTI